MAYEYYTLDDKFRRVQMIEGFQSFIWTERYNTNGDFQIVTKSTHENRILLADQTFIGKAGSTYVMKIDTVSDDTADDGTRNLTITGKSLEALLDDRLAAIVSEVTVTDNTVDPAVDVTTTTLTDWIVTATPGAIARDLFNRICVEGTLDVHDLIPNYVFGTLLPAGNLGEPTDTITLDATPASLYSTLSQLCNTYSLGFRLVRNGDAGEIYFEVYVGNDLTSNQSLKPAVIFETSLNDLDKPSFLTSSSTLKNVAYVYTANGYQIVFSPTADISATGAARRVMLINSSNDLPPGDALNTALTQEGLIALAAQRQVYSFDGELPPAVPYVYGRDYGLGDLVEERNEDGYIALMLVTEQIFSSDDTGDRNYPTLSVSQVLTPGSWLNFDTGLDWADVPVTQHWGDI